MEKRRIYMDYSATTPVKKEVVETMMPYLTDYFGNASSFHSFGREAKEALDKARSQVASLINANPNEIYFTAGGTESDNWAIEGVAFAHRNKGNHIITSKIEHHGVLHPCEYLEKHHGFEVTYLDVDSEGRVDLEQLKNSIKDTTILITIMFANNEIGTIQPIKEIAEIAKEHKIIFHTDAVQAAGNINIDVKELGVDLMSMSSHKIYGPKGIGMLYIKSKTETDKLLHGGGQEREMRGGTENVPYIAGLKRAIELLKEEDDTKLYKNLRGYLLEKLKENFQNGFEINSPLESSLDNILNIRFKSDVFNFISDMLLIKLDLEGVALSGSSACSSGSLKASRILREIGLSEKDALSSIRISFGRFNTKAEIDYLIQKLKKILFETK